MQGNICNALLGAFGALSIVSAASAAGLSEADMEYLATQHVLRASPVLQNLSPKEQVRLRSIINDERTMTDPDGRARNVAEILDEYRGHQLWEQLNPGTLWDEKKR